MTQDNSQPETKGWRTAKADLTFLISEGISSKALESCQGLEYSIRRELGLPEALNEESRIILLDEVLTAAIAEQRQKAFDHREEGTFGTAAGRPANQIAAAGELLGLTDDEQWQQVRDLRCRQFGETWNELRARAGTTDPLTERRLRAMLWLGFGIVKTVERGQPGLIHALESEIKEYARQNRDALPALVAGERPHPTELVVASPAPAANHQSSASTPGEKLQKRRKPVWAAIAAAAVGTAIVVSAVALRDDDQSRLLGSGASIATSAPTQTVIPTRSTPTPSHGITRLAQLPRCHHLPTDSPLAKMLRATNQALIDDRCDAHPSIPVAAHSRPTHRSRTVDHLRTGQFLDDSCLRYGGQKTHNLRGGSSRVWVGYQPAKSKQQAYTPAIWVQGEERAPHCRPSAQPMD